MGFDPDEVNSFLEMVAGEFESLIRQNNDLATELKVINGKLEDYVKIEKTLNQTLLTAQKATDEARVNAQKEAELIIKDAQIRAQTFEDDARRRVNKLEGELISLRNQRDSFLSRFHAVLKAQMDLLETIGGDLQEPKREKKDGSSDTSEETMEEIPPQPDFSSGDTDEVVI